MNKVIMSKPLALQPVEKETAVVIKSGPLVSIPPAPPVIITLPVAPTVEPQERLSNFLRIGRQYHPLAPRGCFVWQRELEPYGRDYYIALVGDHRPIHTCALAAAYAGAFGPESVERPEFSYSMAVWRLSQRVGFDIGQFQVVGPTGRHNNLADEMIKLVDENLWTRAGVADWVESLGV